MTTERRPGGQFFNSNLRLRLISAAVATPLLVLAVAGGPGWTYAVVLTAAAIATYETALLSGASPIRRWLIALPLLALTGFGVLAAWEGNDGAVYRVALAVAPASIALAVVAARPSLDRPQRRVFIAALAAVYFGLLLSRAPALAVRTDGRDWLLVALLGTFAVDSAAYITGRLTGRTKLAPRISPRKTWEGAVGGLVAGAGAVVGLGAVTGLGLPVWQGAALGCGMGVLGAAGDLMESAFKRVAGAGEAGSVIPGHGGILDRMDSLAPNIALVYWAAVGMGA